MLPPNAPKTPIISKINGLVHAKNILPKHRIQSRFRPVLRQKRGVQLYKTNIVNINEWQQNPFKRGYFEILP